MSILLRRSLLRVIGSFCMLMLMSFPLEAKNLQFWNVGSGVDDSDMYRRLAKQFQAETGIRVDVTPLSWGNFSQKYMTAMAAGLPPDSGVASLSAPMEWGSVGGLVDFRNDFGDKFADLEDRFFPGTLPQLTFRKHLYGIPTELVTTMLYYRKDIFKKLGITPPKTWKELNARIKTIEAKGYHFNYGWTRSEQWSLYSFTLPFGLPGLHYGDKGEIVLDWLNPKYQNGVMQAIELWYLHDAFGADSTDRVIGRFLSNQKDESIAMMVEGNWVAGSIEKLSPESTEKWDVVPWPKADKGDALNVMGGTSYVIFKRSRNKDDALTWLKFLNSVSSQQFMMEHRLNRNGQASTFNIPPVKGVWSSDQADFWKRPSMAFSQKVIEASQQVVNTFASFEYLNGKNEVDHLESRILDRMRTYAIQELTTRAEQHDLSRWEFIKAMARGKYAKEHKEIRIALAQRLNEEYTEQYPRALEKVQYALDNYNRDYADIVDNLGVYEHKSSILDVLKWSALILGISLMFLIVVVRRFRQQLSSYIFIAVPCAIALVFVIVPMLTSLYLSFTEYHSVLPLASAKWIGFDHYIQSFHLSDPDNVLVSIGKTILYVAITLPVGIVMSVTFAALLNNQIYGQRFWRFIYFSPLVTSAVSVSLIFTQLYRESSSGWLNALFLKLGIIHNPIQFLQGESSFLYCVMGLAVWHGLAFTILLFLAGLQQIPIQLYKAAEIDGAGWWQKFWHISLPGIRPQLIFVTIMGLIGGFQVFEQIYMLGGGSGFAGSKFGPNDAGKTMVPLIYDLGFEQFKMGRASAVAYILFFVILIFTIAQMRLMRESRPD